MCTLLLLEILETLTILLRIRNYMIIYQNLVSCTCNHIHATTNDCDNIGKGCDAKLRNVITNYMTFEYFSMSLKIPCYFF